MEKKKNNPEVNSGQVCMAVYSNVLMFNCSIVLYLWITKMSSSVVARIFFPPEKFLYTTFTAFLY